MGDIVWDKLSQKKQSELTSKVKRLSQKFVRIDYAKAAHANFITKVKFSFCRLMQKSLHKANAEYLDGKYWAEQGWLAALDRGNSGDIMEKTNSEWVRCPVCGNKTRTIEYEKILN